jgi:GT2 family glycosyltransferase
VAICIITFLRPDGLERCLDSLENLQFVKRRDVTIRVVVIDNDRDGSARPVIERLGDDWRWPIIYDIEPQRGISFARNRAVSHARDARAIAFLDDDEFADPTWLDELLDTQVQFNADIVAGAVVPVFDQQVPRWISEGKYFEKRRGNTGHSLRWASTANVLIRRDVLDWVDGPFDTRFALTGGSDAFLSKQLCRLGARIVFCNEAVVREVIPASRTRLSFILRRAYRRGNTEALCETAMDPRLRRRKISIYKRGFRRMYHGGQGLLLSSVRGHTAAIRALADIAYGCGTVLGLLGHRYQEYRRPTT